MISSRIRQQRIDNRRIPNEIIRFLYLGFGLSGISTIVSQVELEVNNDEAVGSNKAG